MVNKASMESSVIQHPRRLLLDTEATAAMPPSHGNRTTDYYAGGLNFDNNMVIVLVALLCALVCAVGLNSIVRRVLRYRHRFSFLTHEQTPSGLAATGLSQIPVVSYGSGQKISATECPICLGEFAEGEKVRVLPKCNHCFHVKCIDKWLSSQSSCPLCRQPLVDESPGYNNVQEANMRVQLPGNGSGG